MSETAARMRQLLKPWILPLAMLVGMLFHGLIEAVAFLTPYLIFAMLLLTFCRIDFSHIRIGRMVWLLLAVQILGAIGLYYALEPVNPVLAQGIFICVFCPTATAAPVITGMLGGSITRLVTYSLISNAAVAVSAPYLFTVMADKEVSILAETVSIAGMVIPLILAPLGVAVVLKIAVPRVHRAMSSRQGLSFYLWAISLIIVVGRSVNFVLLELPSEIPTMVWLATGALVVCVVQFVLGRIIGLHSGDAVAGAQGLAQKNTVLAIWMTLTYLNPLSSVAPAAYILWQNTINSIQLYYKARKTRP